MWCVWQTLQWSDLSPIWKNYSCLCILFIKTRLNEWNDLFTFNQQHLPPPQAPECCTKTCHETSVWSGWRCTRAPPDPTSTTSCSLSAATSSTTSIRSLLRYQEKIVNYLLSGCQSSSSATSQDMRLHRNLPNRGVVLTLSTWERDVPPHPTEPRPKPRSLPTVSASATPRTPRSWACWHQEVWEWWIFCLPLQVLANCAYSDTDVSNFQN